MFQRLQGRSVSVLLLGLAAPVAAQSPPPRPCAPRTVVTRATSSLRARVHATTLIVSARRGGGGRSDVRRQEVWIVNVRDGLVLEAGEGGRRDRIWSRRPDRPTPFLLSEVSETKGASSRT